MRWSLIFLTGLLAFFDNASAEPVEIEELKGYEMRSTLVEKRMMRSQSETQLMTVSSETHTLFAADGAISATDFVKTTVQGKAPKSSTYKTGSRRVGQPFSFRDGMMVFTFEDSALRRLRTLDEGARMTVYTFSKEGGIISCKADAGFLRENGGGSLKVQSAHVRNVAENKLFSSDCRLQKASSQ